MWINYSINLLDNNDINLLCIRSQTGPDTGQTGQGRLSGLPDHQGVGVARLCQVGQEGGGVEPDEVEPGQRMLVPDQRSVDVVNAGHQVDPWMTDQAGNGSLGLAVPQHWSVNVVNYQVKIGRYVCQNLINMFGCRGECSFNLKNILRYGGQNLLDCQGRKEAVDNDGIFLQ